MGWVTDLIARGRRNRRVTAAVAVVLVAAIGGVVLAVSRSEDGRAVSRDEAATLALVQRAGLDPRDVISADVSRGRDGTDFDIDVGSRHGVRTNDPVLVAGDLVGWVSSSGPRTSYVLTLDNVVDPITADLGNVTADTGVLSMSDNLTRLELIGLPPDATIVDGQTIETSVDADGPIPVLAPAGIPIATVAAINHNRQADNAVTVTPLRNLKRLTEVQVLTHVHTPAHPHEIGVLPDGNSSVINERCPPGGSSCVLTFANGAVFSCLRSIVGLAARWADVPPGTCVREPEPTRVSADTRSLGGCTSRDLAVANARPDGDGGEQITEVFILRNRSGYACSVSGYPVIRVYHDAQALAFSFLREPSGSRRARTLELRPGRQAYFATLAFVGTPVNLCTNPAADRVSRVTVAVTDSEVDAHALTSEGKRFFDYCDESKGTDGFPAADRIELSAVSATPNEATRPFFP